MNVSKPSIKINLKYLNTSLKSKTEIRLNFLIKDYDYFIKEREKMFILINIEN